ncbi:HPP family protein [Guyparkeria sp.]|uniref:HPP family protein n=1 Tax=Guyparkeria sp. TaxID=2035736 RepID=UPI0039705D25
MQLLRCVHPPRWATALIAVIGGAPVHELVYIHLAHASAGKHHASLPGGRDR